MERTEGLPGKKRRETKEAGIHVLNPQWQHPHAREKVLAQFVGTGG
jgi:hypothetical protein